MSNEELTTLLAASNLKFISERLKEFQDALTVLNEDQEITTGDIRKLQEAFTTILRDVGTLQEANALLYDRMQRVEKMIFEIHNR